MYYAQPDGSSIDEVIYPLDAPNGIGLSPDGSRLYVAETHTGRVFEWGVAGPGPDREAQPGVGPRRATCSSAPGTTSCSTPSRVDSAGNVVVGTLAHNAGLTVIAPDGSGVEQVAAARSARHQRVLRRRRPRAPRSSRCSATGKLVSLPWPRPGLALAFP